MKFRLWIMKHVLWLLCISIASVCLLNLLLFYFAALYLDSEKADSSTQSNENHAQPQTVEQSLLHKANTEDKSKRNCTFDMCFKTECCISSIFHESGTRSPYETGHERKYKFYGTDLFNDVKVALSRYENLRAPLRNCSCLHLPSNDFTDLNRLTDKSYQLSENAIVINQLPRAADGYIKLKDQNGNNRFGFAIVASTAHLASSFRHGFDISIPFVYENQDTVENSKRSIFILATGFSQLELEKLKQLKDNNVDALQFCDQTQPTGMSVNHILQRCVKKKDHISEEQTVELIEKMGIAEFCLLPQNSWYQQSDLNLALSSGCIPIITSSLFVLPFESLVDWKSLAVTVHEKTEIAQIAKKLEKISLTQIKELRQKGFEVFKEYFSSMDAVVHHIVGVISSRLQVINSRPSAAEELGTDESVPALSVPIVSGPSKFTAIILTHDNSRGDCLLQIVKMLMELGEVSRVLIVWNNEVRYASPAGAIINTWPPLSKPLKVVNMLSNKLTNRFIPFKDIDTEAVLSLDDDMTALTSQDIRKAFHIWKLNSNRLVGFNGWSIKWSTETSQWTVVEKGGSGGVDGMAILSSGAMFYHNRFASLFSYNFEKPSLFFPMDTSIHTGSSGSVEEQSVDSHFDFIEENRNCEDIAFSLFVTNLTKLQPIVVHSESSSLEGVCTSESESASFTNSKDSRPQQKTNCVNHFYPAFQSTVNNLNNLQFKWTTL